MLAPKLKRGDTIAVFSPSAPVTANMPVRYLRGRSYLEKQGFRVTEGSLTGKKDFYRSGSIAERAEELNALLRNREVRCVMASIGGMNSNSMLPYLDYGALRRDPKIVVGYSDVTALLLGIYAQTGLVTYYGPAMAASFGEFPPLVDETFQYFEDVACGAKRMPYCLPTPSVWTDEFVDWKTQSCAKNTRPNKLITVHGGQAEGRLIGGNLNTMAGIWGSPFMPEIRKGDLLLIEDCLMDAAEVERGFSLLKLNGVFDRIGGLLLGKHEQFNDCGSGRAPWQILREVMGEVDFPVLAEFDCCHTHPMLTTPIGVVGLLDADAQTLTLTEPFIG